MTVFCGTPQAMAPVWRQGTQASGLASGISFAGLSALQMNSVGNVAFIASLSGSGVQAGVNDRGVWAGGRAGASCIARDGTSLTLAGYPGASMRWLTTAKVAAPVSLGPVVVSGSVDGTELGSGVQCVLQQTSSGFSPAMLANTQLPGAAANTLIFLMTPIVGPNGINAYQTTLTGSGVGTVTVNGLQITTDKAITAGMGSQLRTIARNGFQVPTEASGVAYSMVWGGTARLSVNSSGAVAFSASMAGPGIAVGNNWCIWVDTSGQLSRIVRLNDAGPIAGTNIVGFSNYSGASFVTLADTGAVVFTASIYGAGSSSADNGTIIHAHNGVRTLVARGGVDLPVLPTGVRIQNTNIGLGAKVGAGGHVALGAKLEGAGVTTANDAAVFMWTPGVQPGLRLVCREGDTIGQYRITTLSQTGTDLQVNRHGQAVFTATVVNVNDGTQTPRTAIIGAGPEQSAWVVAVEGAPLSLPSGTVNLRTVRMGATDAFNDRGEVAFVIDAGSATVPDEAVVVARLTGPSTPPPCPADYNQSGTLTSEDLFAFLTDWFGGHADFNRSGATDVVDIFDYLVSWFRGCN